MSLLKFFKVFIGIALLSVVISNSKWDQLLSVLESANYQLTLLNIPIYIISIFISSYKWWILVPKLNYVELLKSNFIASYYMVFVPGQVVAEAIKGARLVSEHARANVVFASIFIDKVLAFISLIVVGLCGVMLEHKTTQLSQFKTFLIIILLALILLLFCVPWILSLMDRLLMPSRQLQLELAHLSAESKQNPGNDLNTNSQRLFKEQFLRIRLFLDQLICDYREVYVSLLSSKKRLLASFTIAMLFQMINIAVANLLATSLGIDFGFWTWAWISAILTTVLMLPLSIGGLGLREGGLALMFSMLGESADKSLAYALMLYAFTLVSALIGYFVDLFAGVRKL